jgi:hypothetical protein
VNVNRESLQLPTRIVLSAVLAAATVFALSACGGDEDEQELTFELTGNGKSAQFSVPESAEPGKAVMTFSNKTDEGADMQLIRVEGDHSPEEVVEGLRAAMNGQPFPDWFRAGGGTAAVEPGESNTVTQVLEPGTYYAFDTEGGPPSANGLTGVEVSGDESDAEVDADTTVTASEYKFEADNLEAGRNEIDFKNAGAQPHHLLISPLKGDATAADVEEAFKSEKGPPPIEQKGTQQTAVIEGGESQLVDIDLKPGRYVFYCFITDRQGGPPHALKGMVDEFEVE